jgi:hypothetical protein
MVGNEELGSYCWNQEDNILSEDCAAELYLEMTRAWLWWPHFSPLEEVAGYLAVTEPRYG